MAGPLTGRQNQLVCRAEDRQGPGLSARAMADGSALLSLEVFTRSRMRVAAREVGAEPF
jgi:hypothetical protein